MRMKPSAVAGLFGMWLAALAIPLGASTAAHAQADRGKLAEAQEAQRLLQAMRSDPVAPVVAPEGADVTIVVFSDYQCPYCRRMHPPLQALLREDPKVKIVYRDWPILGPESVEAARAAIAAGYQRRHAAFNDALMASRGRITSEGIRAAAERAGVDWARLQADQKRNAAEIEQALARTHRYAGMLGISGTPALLVNDYLIPGAADLAILRSTVAEARQDAKAAGR